ncbi:hypothetical protein KR009_010946 [Drosophila setifemur]|nr:hypothetical protein KR009_010946 [Drosophila setifemur]
MHRRKTAKSMTKPPPIQGSAKKPTAEAAPVPEQSQGNSDNDIQFELELCWCVQQLNIALESGKLSQKVGELVLNIFPSLLVLPTIIPAEDTAKNLKVLTSRTAPLIKKRQVMKLSMGDYRAKMQQEEKKMMLASKQIKFTSATDTTIKSSFVKKSALLNSGKDFRFDFSVPADSNETDAEAAPKNEEKPASLPNGGLQLESSGSPFKFNFSIEEDPASDINLSSLKLNG